LGQLFKGTSQLIRFFFHKSSAGILLFAFLLSANGLLFGSHAVEEMRLATSRVAGENQNPASFCSLSHHHDQYPSSHADSDCCGAHGHHSHEFRGVQPPIVAQPTFSFHPQFFEGTAHLPEVYLERFIPPQNPAAQISRYQIQVDPACEPESVRV
jgi:hypothetical protein